MAKLTPEEQAAIDAFLAKKAPTVVAEGVGAGLTEKDWREAMQTPGRFDARKLGRDIDVEHQAENEMQRIREERGYYKS